MNPDLVALLAGTVLAVGALAYVLYPLFFATAEHPGPREPQGRHSDDSAILALREIEFDRATGKLSETDYAELKQRYTALALLELRGSSAPELRALAAPAAPAESPDPIEARILAVRLTHPECSVCGVRPEADAVYCSTCGMLLDRAAPAGGEFA